MQKLANTRKMLMITAALSLVLVLGYSYVLWGIFSTDRSVRVLEDKVRQQSFWEDTARATKTLLSETEGDRSRLESRLLADNEVVPFLEHIEGIGKIAGVSLDVKTVDVAEPEQKQDVYEWLKVSVTAEGSWQEIYHFLSLLENIPLALVMDRANLDLSNRPEEFKGADNPMSLWKGRFDFRVVKKKPK